MLEINDDKWQIKVKGMLQEFSQPTVDQEINHQTRLGEIEKDGDLLNSETMRKLYEANMDYLVMLGGEEKVLRGVSRSGFLTILQAIGGEYKKK